MRRLVVVAALTGCVAGADPTTGDPTDPTDPTGGKGDGQANEQCSEQYIEWMLGTFKPAVEEQPLDAARIAALKEMANDAPCRGDLVTGVAWESWFDATSYIALDPYVKQHWDAWTALLVVGPERGDYDLFVERSNVTPEARAAFDVMLAARPAAVLEGLDELDWLGYYGASMDEVLMPLDQFHTQIGYFEGYWTLNAGERDFLDLLDQTRPMTPRDGGYAEWIGKYEEAMRDGFSLDPDDDYSAGMPALGCDLEEPAPCGRDRVLDIYASLAPAARGPLDAEAWMSKLEFWVSFVATSGPAFIENDRAQLARIQAVRPATLVGLAAYKHWLDAVVDVRNRADLFDTEVAPAKPCVDESELPAAEAARGEALGEVSSAMQEAARPQQCPL